MCVCMCVYTYIYIYIHAHKCVHPPPPQRTNASCRDNATNPPAFRLLLYDPGLALSFEAPREEYVYIGSRLHSQFPVTLPTRVGRSWEGGGATKYIYIYMYDMYIYICACTSTFTYTDTIWYIAQYSTLAHMYIYIYIYTHIHISLTTRDLQLLPPAIWQLSISGLATCPRTVCARSGNAGNWGVQHLRLADWVMTAFTSSGKYRFSLPPNRGIGRFGPKP